jgi:hypothetical protein
VTMIDQAFAEAMNDAYRKDYMMRNPPPTAISPIEVYLKHDDGSIYASFGDVSRGMIGYRNKLGGFGPNFAIPAKQSITGWISPDGFVFGCDHYGHWKLANEIVSSLPTVEDEVAGDCEIVLESRGWLKIRHSATIETEPNERQAEVLLSLMGS